MNNYGEILCNSISTIVEKEINDAKYDRTVQAYIIERPNPVEDPTKYKIKYRDIEYIAYATHSKTVYEEGTPVYVLMPESDINKAKIILCSIRGRNDIDIPEIPETEEIRQIVINLTKNNITEEKAQNLIESKLTNFYTQTQVENLIQSELSDVITQEQVQALIDASVGTFLSGTY